MASKKAKPAPKKKPAAKSKAKPKAAKSAAKSTKSKSRKAAQPELAGGQDMAGRLGHNSNGAVNQPLLDRIANIEQLEANKKEISKAIRDEVAACKEEFGVTSAVLKHELKLRKMDSDVRVQFEQGHKDLKDMLGYQMALDLSGGSEDEEQGDGEGEGTGEDEEGFHGDNSAEDAAASAAGFH